MNMKTNEFQYKTIKNKDLQLITTMFMSYRTSKMRRMQETMEKTQENQRANSHISRNWLDNPQISFE